MIEKTYFINSWELIRAILNNEIKSGSILKIFTKDGYDYIEGYVLEIDSSYENINDYDYQLINKYGDEISPDFLLSNNYYYEVK